VDLCPPWDSIGFQLICVYFERAIPQDFIIFFAIHGTSKTCLDASPWIKAAMGLNSSISRIAMRAEAQLAARGAHNPQVMDSQISSHRIHDAELYWHAELFICNWLLGLVA
jgi:hypothetical protein